LHLAQEGALAAQPQIELSDADAIAQFRRWPLLCQSRRTPPIRDGFCLQRSTILIISAFSNLLAQTS
jgi:hypothetical protein